MVYMGLCAIVNDCYSCHSISRYERDKCNWLYNTILDMDYVCKYSYEDTIVFFWR